MEEAKGLRIDALQYCNWSSDIFAELRQGGLDAIHATVCYHEDFAETLANIEAWERRFEDHAGLIMPGREAGDVLTARETGRTAVFFGLQNPKPVESDLARIATLHERGVRFMQLTYNRVSAFATGWQDSDIDAGVTGEGRRAITEMNRLGMVVDLSHAAERSSLEAIEVSGRPVAITHANPRAWRDTGRNVTDDVLRALAGAGGMLGFSLYPHHLKDGSACTLDSFCQMAARTADIMGIDHIGIGSDLCQGQPDTVVRWMRSGSWQPDPALADVRFPEPPAWFSGNTDFPGIAKGLRAAGFSADEVSKIMGDNWMRFFAESFRPDTETTAKT